MIGFIRRSKMASGDALLEIKKIEELPLIVPLPAHHREPRP